MSNLRPILCFLTLWPQHWLNYSWITACHTYSAIYVLVFIWIISVFFCFFFSSLTHFDQHLYYSNVLCNHTECFHCFIEIHNIISSVDSSREHNRHRRWSVLFICAALMELLMSWFMVVHGTFNMTSHCWKYFTVHIHSVATDEWPWQVAIILWSCKSPWGWN